MKKLITLLLILLPYLIYGQTDLFKAYKKPFSKLDVGIEFQAYPTGLLPGIKVETNLGRHDVINLRGAVQLINHFNFGVHKTEKGEGGGFTIGYRHYFLRKSLRGFYLSAKTDFWFNHIRWADEYPIAGETDIVVFQPTAEAGWMFRLFNDRAFIAPSIAFGYEWNIVTHGEPTGQGTIILGGISLGYTFHLRKGESSY